MTWFKVDDGFWGHPKQTALPAAPVALWVRAGSWSGNQLTDGFVPAHMVVMLGARKRDADQLVAAGLWEDAEGGYQFHDWTKWQPTREDVEKKRADDADRKAEWRRKKAAAKAAEEAAEAEMSQRDSGRTDAVTPRGVRSTRPDPTRPDPTRSSPTEKSEPSRTTSRGGVTEVDARETPPLYSDRCKRHGNDPTPGPCGQCADVRKANQQRPTTPDYRLRVVPELCGECDDRWIDTADGYVHCPRCHPSEVRAAPAQPKTCSYHPGNPAGDCHLCDQARERYRREMGLA